MWFETCFVHLIFHPIPGMMSHIDEHICPGVENRKPAMYLYTQLSKGIQATYSPCKYVTCFIASWIYG